MTNELQIPLPPAEPITVDPRDPKALHKAELEGDHRESTLGRSQGDIEISRLSARLALLKQEHARRGGPNIDSYGNADSLTNEITALERTLDWQRRMRASRIEQETTAAVERDRGFLTSAYETDFVAAVNRELAAQKAKGLHLTNAEAADAVKARIALEGEAVVLPQYARVKARLGG